MLNNPILSLKYNPDVLDCLANLSNDEVFTPPGLVNQMLDMLPQELFRDPNTTFFDPATKTGVFLREIAIRLIEGLREVIPDRQERIDHIFQKQIFGIAITELTSLMARRSLYCSKYPNSIYSVSKFDNADGNIRFLKINHKWNNERCAYCGASQSQYDREASLETHAYEFIHTTRPKEIFNMKFDVIIGNPPYQLSDGGAQASAMPIYQKFILQAIKLKPMFLVMITPSRWFTGGRGLDDFRRQMIKENQIKEIHDFVTASECFPGVEIKGGVNYFLWERDFFGKCKFVSHRNNSIYSTDTRYLAPDGLEVVVRYNDALIILNKIRSIGEKTFDQLISSQRPFGFRTFFTGKKDNFPGSIKIYANHTIGYVNQSEIEQNEAWVKMHKIIIPRAIGNGDSKTDNIKPIYSEPLSCCSETYVVCGPFDSEKECSNVISFIQTRFFHFLLTLQKNTMMAPKNVYSFIPQQDFSKPWDDPTLYKKYGLTNDEINYIETMVWPDRLESEFNA
jgi:hypothetical protein